MLIDMLLLKFISPKILSQQAKKPYGFLGKYIISKSFNKNNEALNIFTKNLVDVQKNDKILEIGFGTGLLINKMVKDIQSGFIEGVDFSKEMFEYASKVNKQYITKGIVKLKLLESNKLPYQDNTFDKVCSVNVIYFWDNPKEYLQEILRIMKPKGKIVIGFRDKIQMESLKADDKIFNLYTKQQIIKLMIDAGYKNVHIKSKNDYPLISYCTIGYK